VRWPSADT